MPEGPDASLNSDGPLNEVLRGYLEELDAGRSPDRAALERQHPELAAELRAFFADQDQAQRIARAMQFEATALQFPHEPGKDSIAAEFSRTADASVTRLRYFGNYELLTEIARGGMGVVYKARQAKLDRLVAVKMILAGQLASPTEVARFRSEAQAAANLDHPGIVPIHEVGEHDGQHFYSMGYVDGPSLAARLSSGPLAPREAAELLIAVARGVHYAHEQGVIHRDLKPSNILLGVDGQPRVTDFGLAKRLGGDSDLTATGQVLGTPSYMPPEQAAGAVEKIKEASDIYSLGAILYACLTGRPPFQAANPIETLMQVRYADPASPRLLNPTVSKDLETICLKCLEKEPKNRYPTALAFADDLQRFLNHEPIQARAPGWIECGTRWVRKQKRSALVAVSAAVAAVMLLLGGVFAWERHQQSLLGRMRFDSDNSTLTAEILKEDGTPALPPFRLPTIDPISLPEGAYQLRLIGSGLLSETFLFEVERGQEQRYKVDLRASQIGQSIDALSPWSSEMIDLGQGLDVIEGPHSTSPEQTNEERRTMRRISQATGKVIWEVDWKKTIDNPALAAALKPESKDFAANQNHWNELLPSWDHGENDSEQPPPQLLRPAPDLNDDGVGDLVYAFTTMPRVGIRQGNISRSWRHGGGPVIAVSGKDGHVLWEFRAKPNQPGGGPSVGTIIGLPLLLKRPGEPSVLIGLFATWQETWLEAIQADTGESLWRYQATQAAGVSLPMPSRTPGSAYEPKLCNIGGKSVVAFAAGQRLFGVDPATGKPAWTPHEMNNIPHGTPRIADFDGDGSDDIAVVHMVPNTNTLQLTALSPTDWRVLFQIDLASDDEQNRFRSSYSRRPATEWPLLADLDGNGNCELLVHQEADYTCMSGRRESFHGLKIVEANTGRIRWERRFPVQPEMIGNSPEQEYLVDRYTIAPDIDGDGIRDVIQACVGYGRGRVTEDERRASNRSLFVDALSGKDGHTLWMTRIPLGNLGNSGAVGGIGELLWGPAGLDGLPQLAVPFSHAADSEVWDERERHSLYYLATRTGQLSAQGNDLLRPRFADFDGDGLLDLCAFVPGRPSQFGSIRSSVMQRGKVTIFQGEPPVAWRRLGRHKAIQDLDHDGLVEVAVDAKPDSGAPSGSRSQGRFSIVSGKTGRPLLKAEVDWEDDRNWTPTVFDYPLLPAGDFDQDGTPDILASRHAPAKDSTGPFELPLRAISGKTGKLLWKGGTTTFSDPNKHHNGLKLARLIYVAARKGEGPNVLCALDADDFSSNSTKAEKGLALVSGRDGNVLWTYWFPSGHGGNLPAPYALADVNHDGVTDVVMLSAVGQNQTSSATLELSVINGADGAVLWQHDLLWWENGGPAAVAPIAVDLTGKGKWAVLTISQKRSPGGQSGMILSAFDALTGKNIFEFDPATKTGAATECQFCTANLRGDGRRSICLGARTANGECEQILLDEQGQLLDRRKASSVYCAAADLLGDGQDELLQFRDGKLRATRNGFDELLWERALNFDRIVIEQPDPKKSPIVLYSSAGSIYGLDGKTGSPLWRGQYDPTGDFTLPRFAGESPRTLPIVVSAARDRTISTASFLLPADHDGKYQRDVGDFKKQIDEPQTNAADDPRFIRPLPWKGMDYHLKNFFLAYLRDALLIVFLPGWLIWQVIGSRSWTISGMFVMMAAVAISLAGCLAFADPRTGQLFVRNWGLIVPHVLTIAFFYFMVRWLLTRAWWRIALTTGALLTGMAVFAMVNFAQDPFKSALQQYAWEGWWMAIWPGITMAGMAIYAVYFLSWPAKWIYRKFAAGREKSGDLRPAR